MTNDPIIDELHAVRARIADEHHNDLRAIADAARARQAASGVKPVSLPPRRPAPRTPPAAKKAG